jgi:hypothetical protein
MNHEPFSGLTEIWLPLRAQRYGMGNTARTTFVPPGDREHPDGRPAVSPKFWGCPWSSVDFPTWM